MNTANRALNYSIDLPRGLDKIYKKLRHTHEAVATYFTLPLKTSSNPEANDQLDFNHLGR